MSNKVKEIIQMAYGQLLFDEGVLISASVVKTEVKNYHLVMKSKKKNYVMASARKASQIRDFKSIDAACLMAERIGFKKVEINL